MQKHQDIANRALESAFIALVLTCTHVSTMNACAPIKDFALRHLFCFEASILHCVFMQPWSGCSSLSRDLNEEAWCAAYLGLSCWL